MENMYFVRRFSLPIHLLSIIFFFCIHMGIPNEVIVLNQKLNNMQ